MSTDTPTPERVTLTDEDDSTLADWWVSQGGDYEDLAIESLTDAVGEIVAAREQALREEIAGRLEWEASLEFARAERAKAVGIDATHHHGQRLGFEVSARIARGGAR